VAIQENSKRIRTRIRFWGGMPVGADAEAFQARGFSVEPCEGEWLDEPELAVTDSVVISQSAENLKGIFQPIKDFADRLLEFDCRVYIRVASGPKMQGRERTTVANIIKQLRLPAAGLTSEEQQTWALDFQDREANSFAPYVYLCDSGWSWDRLAQTILENPASFPPNLALTPDASDKDKNPLGLSQESITLLRRSFWDCKEVHLEQMQDGLSGVHVFKAYARAKGPLLGEGWWTSYFVKIGDRKKIISEYENYVNYALEYIPFNLAPRLNPERCGLGARQGIIVGDFVDLAESLKDCAWKGRSAHALGTLFTHTLIAWLHASHDREEPLGRFLPELLPDNVEIPEERKAIIRSLGGNPDLKQISGLVAQCAKQPVRVGTIHGDLNASNILVRLSDAIIIDLEKMRQIGPLLYDPASVEASLLVDGFKEDRREIKDWLRSIDSLYDDLGVFDLRTPCHPKDGSAWFFECVRTIRIHARPLELTQGQYALFLALALIKKSWNPEMFKDRRDGLRAAAYVLGERILKLVVDGNRQNP
jgi:hypothetical protein